MRFDLNAFVLINVFLTILTEATLIQGNAAAVSPHDLLVGAFSDIDLNQTEPIGSAVSVDDSSNDMSDKTSDQTTASQESDSNSLPPQVTRNDAEVLDSPVMGGTEKDVVQHQTMLSTNSSPRLAEEVMQAGKPKLEADLERGLPKFQPNHVGRMCSDVAHELMTNDATSQAADYFDVVVRFLASVDETDGPEKTNLDKNVKEALSLLADNLLDRFARSDADDSSHDFVHYLTPIITCKINLEKDWTILQSVIALGLQQSLKQSFIKEMHRGTHHFDPATHLDANGNTLLHLAVMSSATQMAELLMALQRKVYQTPSKHDWDYYYWAIGAMEHRNHDGLRPLDLAENLNVGQKLKMQYRVYTNMLRLRLKEHAKEKGFEYLSGGVFRRLNSSKQEGPTLPYVLPSIPELSSI